MELLKRTEAAMYVFPIIVIFLVSTFSISVLSVDSDCVSNNTEAFLDSLIQRAGGAQSVTIQQFSDIFKEILGKNTSENSCLGSSNSVTANISGCIKEKCLSTETILQLHGVSQSSSLSTDDLYRISPALLHNFLSCDLIHRKAPEDESEVGHHKKPTSVATWGYSFLFVTLINVCSLAGAFVLPFMKKSIYRKILMFMVALAVGSLAGSGLLVLVPEAFGFMEDPQGGHDYIWKATTIVGGVYLFFIIERLLKIIFEFRQTHSKKGSMSRNVSISVEAPFLSEKKREEGNELKDDHMITSIKRTTPVTANQKYKDTTNLQIPTSKSVSSSSSTRALDECFDAASSADMGDGGAGDNHLGNGHLRREDEYVVDGHSHGDQPIKTVAWMIIFGDGLHNFIDGLSIGAAFTDSIFAGISISLAVICEELPHELGDFAILLNAGMTVKRALFYNFLSACMCYLGCVIGIFLGENTTAHTWIFGIAGGMFLYISLVDMMPEMNSAAEDKENKKQFGSMYIFIIQNIGMFIGFGVILLMAVYGGEINIE